MALASFKEKLNQRVRRNTNLKPPKGDLLGVPYLDPESGLSNPLRHTPVTENEI